MKSITLICFVLLTGLSFVSCKKNSKKWITGEFQIIDLVTKEPVKATLELNYFAGYLFGSEEVTEQLGSTTDNGFFEFEKKIHRKDRNFKLNIDAVGYYGSYQSSYPDASQELSIANHNVMIIEVSPLYIMSLTLNNISCFDATDSIWINRTVTPEHSRIFTGCLNDYKTGEVFYWAQEDTVSFRSISKKNGVYDTLVHFYTMQHGIENNFDLNY